MKVLHIHLAADPRASGTAIVVLGLHSTLPKYGVESTILCQRKADEVSGAVLVPEVKSRVLRKVEARLQHYATQQGLNAVVPFRSALIPRTAAYQEADLLHIHTLHNSVYSYLSLPRLTRPKPAVYTFHDMWPMTGHCYHSFGCDRWQHGCGKCPHPEVYPAIEKDNTRLEWHLKKWAFGRSDLAVAAPSTWMADLAKQSIFGGKPIFHIPNGIDAKVFRPLDPARCRQLLKLPQDKHVLMAGAVTLTRHTKGGDLLIKALQDLPAPVRENTCLLLMGHDGEAIAEAVEMQARCLGFVEDEEVKAMALSAADILAYPTRADNNPLMLLESMACGTPMVSFRIGGVPDLVRPGVTGLLAEPEDVEGFRDGMVHLLEDEPLRAAMSRQCRAIAEEEYTVERCAQRYAELYRHLLYGSPFPERQQVEEHLVNTH